MTVHKKHSLKTIQFPLDIQILFEIHNYDGVQEQTFLVQERVGDLKPDSKSWNGKEANGVHIKGLPHAAMTHYRCYERKFINNFAYLKTNKQHLTMNSKLQSTLLHMSTRIHKNFFVILVVIICLQFSISGQDDASSQRYLRWADAYMIVYSITDRTSFEIAREYLQRVSEYLRNANKDCPIALVGNKCDLERYR